MVPGTSVAVVLDLPTGAEVLADEARGFDTATVATGPFAETLPAMHPEGDLSLQSWRIPAADLGTLDILAPLSAQLEAAGFTTLFACADTDCGGFDFRYALDILPAPRMQVSLGDFRYLAAEREGEHVTLLVSRMRETAYLQLTRVGPMDRAAPDLAVSTRSPAPEVTAQTDFGVALETEGRVVLSDLVFESGSSDLGSGAFMSLEKLSDYLNARPGRSVALVGHTDTVGALGGNIALSRERARSVRERLISRYGVDADQLEAEGMGYLAPLSSNLTEGGREANRRVEVILTSTE